MKNLDKPIYLDSNSTTPVDPRVLEAMIPFYTGKFGNSSSKTHSYGWDADFAVENARKQIAKLIHCDAREITFTSGGTESNNMVLQGIVYHHLKNGREKIHIISSEIEHHAILDVLKRLELFPQVDVTYVKPDKYGRIDPIHISNNLRPETALVSIIFANNEIGTINAIEDIGQLCESHNIPFHTDAVQALGLLPVDVQKLKIDFLSISAHKMYGPKGVGALFIRHNPKRMRIEPILFGSQQEKGLRPGTLNVPGIVGLGKACEITFNERDSYVEKIEALKNNLTVEILKIPYAKLNGHPLQRLPNNINITFEGIPQGELIRALKNLAISTGSACTSGTTEPSHVLRAIGLSETDCYSTIRIGISKYTTDGDIKKAAHDIQSVVHRLKSL